MQTAAPQQKNKFKSIAPSFLLCTLAAITNVPAHTQSHHTSAERQITAALDSSAGQMTEVIFEVERVTPQTELATPMPTSNAAAAEQVVMTAAVTYAAIPNKNRTPTTSKIAVATEAPVVTPPQTLLNSLDQNPAPTGPLATDQAFEELLQSVTPSPITAEVPPVISEASRSGNVVRRATPSKIAVNADVSATAYTAATAIQQVQAAPVIPPRDASTYFYLSAPSKTPVAALDVFEKRSGQLPLKLNASSALIIDQASKEILYSKNPLNVMPIASISKLMTAMVVLDAKQNLNQKITITSADIDTLKSTSSRLHVGAQLTRRDLLHLALMSSENRAAHALSRNYPGGKKAFMAAMNAKARELGMTQTYFEDPTGLSSNNRSSAQDLVWLVNAAYRYDLIRNLSTSRNHKVTTGGARLQYRSSNALIRDQGWNIGVQKTGYIREAGYCLVMQTQISGKSVIVVLLDAEAKNKRIDDVKRIRSWIQ